jgi:hypothetical protein
MSRKNIAAVFAVSGLLVACGGGGSGSSSAPAPSVTPVATLADLTNADQPGVARQAGITLFGYAGVNYPAASATGLASIFNASLADSQMKELSALKQNTSGGILMGAVTQKTVAATCTTGSGTISTTEADTSIYSAGDITTSVYNNCVDPTSKITRNGKLVYIYNANGTVNDYNQNLIPYTTNYSNYLITYPASTGSSGLTYLRDGSESFSSTKPLVANGARTITWKATNLTQTYNTIGVSNSAYVEKLSDLTAKIDYSDYGSSATTSAVLNSSSVRKVSFTGTYSSPKTSGMPLQVMTTTPFSINGLDGTNYPNSGEMVLKGASNKALRVRASTSNLSLTPDSNGDGIYEENNTQTTPWQL